MDLSRFPRRHYSVGATPLEFMPNFTRALAALCPAGQGPRVWIKRDDMLGLFPGGNKTRKLEFLVADALAVVIAEIGAITERRIAMLVDTVVSRLPAFLTPEPGLNSGFMIVHVTAAALASENKSLAHPASVDSLPTSANQEDHVSMATFAARRLQSMLRNTEYIVAIELLAAAQGIEFLRPLKSSAVLEGILALVRSVSPAMMVDRSLAPDMELVRSLITQGRIGLAGEAQISELSALRLG